MKQYHNRKIEPLNHFFMFHTTKEQMIFFFKLLSSREHQSQADLLEPLIKTNPQKPTGIFSNLQ